MLFLGTSLGMRPLVAQVTAREYQQDTDENLLHQEYFPVTHTTVFSRAS